MGHFNMPLAATNEKHYLAFAAGSGITPMLSIIKTTLQTEPKSRFTLIYGNRASSTVIFKEELTDLKDVYMERLNLVYVMSREQQDIELFNGRITREKCDQFFKHWIQLDDVDAAFICGPEDMIHAVSDSLQAHGMNKSDIKVELFAASIPKNKANVVRPVIGKQECEVTVVIDGYHTVFTMERKKNRCSTPRSRTASTCVIPARAAYAPPAAAKWWMARSTWTSTMRWKIMKLRAASC